MERARNPRDHALVALLRYAGLRVGEAIRVRIGEVEISERKGRVVVRTGKGMKRREVPLGTEAREMISPLLSKATGDWLFPGQNGSHLSARAAQDVIRKYAYQAHLEGVTPHVLRHYVESGIMGSAQKNLGFQSHFHESLPIIH